MDFTTHPVSPLKLNVPPEYYKDVLKNYKYNPDSIWPILSGDVQIDEKNRFVKFGLTEGLVTDIEICEIEKDDTFCGISMRQRPKKFQKLLAEAEFDSRIEDGGLNLTDHPVGFFIEGGRIASICWELVTPSHS